MEAVFSITHSNQNRVCFQDRSATVPLSLARVPYNCVCFCLHAFTWRGKLQSNRRLRVKAKGVLSFTTFTTFRGFSFTGNSLTACNVGDSVKVVKAKNKTFNVVTRVYA